MEQLPVLLDEWSIQYESKDDQSSGPTELSQCYLVGTVYNYPHPDVPDGSLIETTSITNIVDNKVTTETGITYYLMTPEAKYAEFLKTNGLEDHISNVTRVNNN